MADSAQGNGAVLVESKGSSFSAEQVKVLALCGIGGAIELYEFIVFIMLTPYISQAFFPASTPEWLRTIQTLAIFAIGYFVRPIGGIVISMPSSVTRGTTFVSENRVPRSTSKLNLFIANIGGMSRRPR